MTEQLTLSGNLYVWENHSDRIETQYGQLLETKKKKITLRCGQFEVFMEHSRKLLHSS